MYNGKEICSTKVECLLGKGTVFLSEITVVNKNSAFMKPAFLQDIFYIS